MSDFSLIKAKVDALKAKIENNSITPLYLGSLLDEIVETARDAIEAAASKASLAIDKSNSASAIANEMKSSIGVPNGIAPVGNDGVVPSKYLPPVPNMVGKFSDDSMPEDWFWWPTGEKVAIPVNPATGEFSYYFDGEITQTQAFNPEYIINAGMALTKIERLDKIPPFGQKYSLYMFLSGLFNIETCPVIDCGNLAYNDLSYLAVNNSKVFKCSHVKFTNTDKLVKCQMIFNLNPTNNLKAVTGLDLSSCKYFGDTPLGRWGAAVIDIKNLGKSKEITNGNVIDCRSVNWGDDSKAVRARRSLVDSLLTSSFNRMANYGPSYTTTLYIYRSQANRLSQQELEAIAAKGYNVAIDDSY